MTRRPAYPASVKRALLVVRAGLALAALGIVAFLLSYSRVAAPAVAATDTHAVPWLAWAGIFAWSAGMLLAVFGRTLVRRAVHASGPAPSAPREVG